MKFNKESFIEALKENNIVKYKAYFEAVVKSYLEIENKKRNSSEIPDWIVKYDAANYLSSAGRAVRILMEIINR